MSAPGKCHRHMSDAVSDELKEVDRLEIIVEDADSDKEIDLLLDVDSSFVRDVENVCDAERLTEAERSGEALPDSETDRVGFRDELWVTEGEREAVPDAVAANVVESVELGVRVTLQLDVAAAVVENVRDPTLEVTVELAVAISDLLKVAEFETVIVREGETLSEIE
jgi:hypothetical protein